MSHLSVETLDKFALVRPIPHYGLELVRKLPEKDLARALCLLNRLGLLIDRELHAHYRKLVVIVNFQSRCAHNLHVGEWRIQKLLFPRELAQPRDVSAYRGRTNFNLKDCGKVFAYLHARVAERDAAVRRGRHERTFHPTRKALLVRLEKVAWQGHTAIATIHYQPDWWHGEAVQLVQPRNNKMNGC